MPCCLPDSVAQRRLVNAKNFFAKLKRRHVYRVAVAYAAVAWLLIQSDRGRSFVFLRFANWGVRLIVLFIVIGSPGALVLAWAFELTRKGIKRTEDVGPNEPRRRRTGRQLTALIMVAAVIASGLLIFKSLGPPRGAVPIC